MADFVITVGDLQPPLLGRLEDELGNPVDFTGESEPVNLRLVVVHALTGAEVVSALATVLVPDPADLTSATEPNVRYDWSAGDLPTAGTFHAVWRFVRASGKPETYPNDGPLVLSVTRRLGSS